MDKTLRIACDQPPDEEDRLKPIVAALIKRHNASFSSTDGDKCPLECALRNESYDIADLLAESWLTNLSTIEENGQKLLDHVLSLRRWLVWHPSNGAPGQNCRERSLDVVAKLQSDAQKVFADLLGKPWMPTDFPKHQPTDPSGSGISFNTAQLWASLTGLCGHFRPNDGDELCSLVVPLSSIDQEDREAAVDYLVDAMLNLREDETCDASPSHDKHVEISELSADDRKLVLLRLRLKVLERSNVKVDGEPWRSQFCRLSKSNQEHTCRFLAACVVDEWRPEVDVLRCLSTEDAAFVFNEYWTMLLKEESEVKQISASRRTKELMLSLIERKLLQLHATMLSKFWQPFIVSDVVESSHGVTSHFAFVAGAQPEDRDHLVSLYCALVRASEPLRAVCKSDFTTPASSGDYPGVFNVRKGESVTVITDPDAGLDPVEVITINGDAGNMPFNMLAQTQTDDPEPELAAVDDVARIKKMLPNQRGPVRERLLSLLPRMMSMRNCNANEVLRQVLPSVQRSQPATIVELCSDHGRAGATWLMGQYGRILLDPNNNEARRNAVGLLRQLDETAVDALLGDPDVDEGIKMAMKVVRLRALPPKTDIQSHCDELTTILNEVDWLDVGADAPTPVFNDGKPLTCLFLQKEQPLNISSDKFAQVVELVEGLREKWNVDIKVPAGHDGAVTIAGLPKLVAAAMKELAGELGDAVAVGAQPLSTPTKEDRLTDAGSATKPLGAVPTKRRKKQLPKLPVTGGVNNKELAAISAAEENTIDADGALLPTPSLDQVMKGAGTAGSPISMDVRQKYGVSLIEFKDRAAQQLSLDTGLDSGSRGDSTRSGRTHRDFATLVVAKVVQAATVECMTHADAKAGRNYEGDASAGSTALLTSAVAGDLPAVQGIAAVWPEDVNKSESEGQAPLYKAAMEGHLEVVQWLVLNGSSAGQEDNHGLTPLYVAAAEGHLEVVKWLAINSGSAGQPDNDGYTPLHAAAQHSHLEVVQWLAGNGGSVTQPANDGTTPLCAAAQEGHLAVVQWLAGHGGSVTQPANDGTTPLCAAAQEGHLAVVQWLASHGGSVTQLANDGTTPLCAAAQEGHLAVVQWLASHGGSVTQLANDGTTPLCAAAQEGHLAVVQWLAINGGSVTQANDYGYTPLDVARRRKHTAVVEWLVYTGTEHNDVYDNLTNTGRHYDTPREHRPQPEAPPDRVTMLADVTAAAMRCMLDGFIEREREIKSAAVDAMADEEKLVRSSMTALDVTKSIELHLKHFLDEPVDSLQFATPTELQGATMPGWYETAFVQPAVNALCHEFNFRKSEVENDDVKLDQLQFKARQSLAEDRQIYGAAMAKVEKEEPKELDDLRLLAKTQQVDKKAAWPDQTRPKQTGIADGSVAQLKLQAVQSGPQFRQAVEVIANKTGLELVMVKKDTHAHTSVFTSKQTYRIAQKFWKKEGTLGICDVNRALLIAKDCVSLLEGAKYIILQCEDIIVIEVKVCDLVLTPSPQDPQCPLASTNM